EATRDMLDRKMTIKEIAQERALSFDTIFGHIEKIKKKDPTYNIYNLQNMIPKNKFKTIYSAFRQIGLAEDGHYRLTPVKELLGDSYSYDDLRLVRLFL